MPIPEPLQVLTTIRDLVRWGASEFERQQLSFGHGFATALDEARYLTLHALALPFDIDDDYLNAVLTLPEREQVIEQLCRGWRRASQRPISRANPGFAACVSTLTNACWCRAHRLLN